MQNTLSQKLPCLTYGVQSSTVTVIPMKIAVCHAIHKPEIRRCREAPTCRRPVEKGVAMKFQIAWHTDPSGMLVGARVHDSHLVKFAVTDAVSLEFGMWRLSSDIVTAELVGLGEFNVAALWSGAIISEIFVWNVCAVPEECWSVPDSAWNVLLGNEMKLLDKKREAARIAQKRPNAQLVQFACSYGGNLAAVCDRIAIFEILQERGNDVNSLPRIISPD
jgi:hypothetical protein